MQTEFTIVHNSEPYDVDVNAHISTYHYGADADGNRGEQRVDCEIGNCTIHDELGYDVTQDMYDKLYPTICEKCVDEWESMS